MAVDPKLIKKEDLARVREIEFTEMFGYSNDLRSKTQGRGQYTMEPHSYTEVPKSVAESIMNARKRNDD
mgnify:CR=1 FL=1